MAKLAHTTALSAFACLGLFACGGAGGAGGTSRTASRPPAKPVFVVHGGFFSCKLPWSTPLGSQTYTHAKPMIDAAQSWSGSPVAFVVTCFGSGHDTAWVQTDLNPTSTGVPAGTIPDLVADRVAQVGEGAEVVLIGHSWGGWLAMSDALKLPESAHLRYLATLDPISWQTCPPSTLITSVLGGTPSGAPEEPCTTAPEDLAPDYAAIRERAAYWGQYYQDQFSYLHSTAIDAADVSRHLVYDGLSSASEWEAHGMVDRDDTVYGGVGDALTGPW